MNSIKFLSSIDLNVNLAKFELVRLCDVSMDHEKVDDQVQKHEEVGGQERKKLEEDGGQENLTYGKAQPRERILAIKEKFYKSWKGKFPTGFAFLISQEIFSFKRENRHKEKHSSTTACNLGENGKSL